MTDLPAALLCRALSAVAEELARDPANAAVWARAQAAVGAASAAGPLEPDLAAAVTARDAAALQAIVAAWASGKRHLPEQDREILKRAMKAFRKSLGVTQLDDASAITGRAMSGGRGSGIVGIVPPPRYPREVWDELVRQGRLVAARHGIYELPPE